MNLETHPRGTLTGAPCCTRACSMCPFLPGRKPPAASAPTAAARPAADWPRSMPRTAGWCGKPMPSSKSRSRRSRIPRALKCMVPREPLFGPRPPSMPSAAVVYIGTGRYLHGREGERLRCDHRARSCDRQGQVAKSGHRERQLLDGLQSQRHRQLPDGDGTGSRFRRIADPVHAAQWQRHHSRGPEVRRRIWNGSGSGAKRCGATRSATAVRWAASNGAWLRMRSSCTSRWPICSRRRRRARRACTPWIPPPASSTGTRPRRRVACSYSGRCLSAQSAAPSVIPGVVFSTTIDGHLRAYDVKMRARSCGISTRRRKSIKPSTASRTKAAASLDVAGPVVAGGMMYIISGICRRNGGAAQQCAAGLLGGRQIV